MTTSTTSPGDGKANDVVVVEPSALAPSDGAAGLALVIQNLAANPSVDIAKLEKIIDLQERILAHEAKAAFDAAFARMQAELPVILERGKTDKAKYARLEDIIGGVRPVLAKHGFSLSHQTEWLEGGRIKVTGILAHEAGHEHRSEFVSLADKSGSKNDIQALGSAQSYGRRYTTKDLLLLAERGEDDDGTAAGRKAESQQTEEPAGFAAWADDMASVAEEGMARFNAAWKASNPTFTAHALKCRRALSEGWKNTAMQADRRNRERA